MFEAAPLKPTGQKKKVWDMNRDYYRGPDSHV